MLRSVRTYNVRCCCVDWTSIELNQQFKCPHNGIQLDYYCSFHFSFRSGRENSSKLAALTLMFPPRAYSHSHTLSLGISSFICCCCRCVMATNMKISHDEKYSAATAATVVRRALDTDCSSLDSLLFWFHIECMCEKMKYNEIIWSFLCAFGFCFFCLLISRSIRFQKNIWSNKIGQKWMAHLIRWNMEMWIADVFHSPDLARAF